MDQRKSPRSRRGSISAEAFSPDDVSIPTVQFSRELSEGEFEELEKATANCFLFVGLDQDQRRNIYRAMEEVTRVEGEFIIKQGDEGDYFYILKEGEVSIFIDDARVATCKPGSVFGELALMYNCPRTASVVSSMPVRLRRLDRSTFRQILIRQNSVTLARVEKLLNSSKMFKGLSREAIAKVANAIQVETFEPDEVVLEQGEINYSSMKFYIILEGVAQAAINTPGKGYKSVKNLSSGDFFGERSLLHRAPRSATIYAKTRLKCGVLEHSAFERLLGPYKDIIQLHANRYLRSRHSLVPTWVESSVQRGKDLLKWGPTLFNRSVFNKAFMGLLLALVIKLIWGQSAISFSMARNDAVVVTGCDSSIGFQIAQTLIQKNATVVMTCAKKQPCNKGATWLMNRYPKAVVHTLELDPTSAKSIETFVSNLKYLRLPLQSWIMYTDSYHGFFNFNTDEGINSLYAVAYSSKVKLAKELQSILYYTSIVVVSGGSYVSDENGNYLYNPSQMFASELNRRLNAGNAAVVNSYCFDPYSAYLPIPRRMYAAMKFVSDSICATFLKGKRQIADVAVEATMNTRPISSIPSKDAFEAESWDRALNLYN